jgi:hypothetical protein
MALVALGDVAADRQVQAVSVVATVARSAQPWAEVDHVD